MNYCRCIHCITLFIARNRPLPFSIFKLLYTHEKVGLIKL